MEGGRATVPDLILAADEVVRQRSAVEEILSAHTGRGVDQLREDLDRDLVLTAQSALEFGIIDTIAHRRPVAAAAVASA
jgi:ATP-dependent Clp protease protease subunit